MKARAISGTLLTILSVMVVLALFLASALVVKNDGTEIRAGCDKSDSVVATASAGAPAEIRFSMSGDMGSCYKVTVSTAGKTFDGYVPVSALSGTEEYQKAVQSAPLLGATRGQTAAPGPQVRLPQGSADHPLVKASAMLEQHQPGAALQTVEASMKAYGRDYQSLVLAGIAAERADQPRVALDYLKEAQAIRPDRSVEQLIARLEKEISGDKSGEKLYGTRFLLRYEGGQLDSEVARGMVGLLEQEFSRISAELGCRTNERIVTVVQSRQAYRAASMVAEWSGGHFDGARIKVPIAEGRSLSEQTRETFAHELVHACLANLGQWPAWLHEGMAQRLTGKRASVDTRHKIGSMRRSNRLPRLENMSQSWSRLSGEHAAIAYDYALVATDMLFDLYSGYGIQNVLRAPERLPQVTAEIDKNLMR